MHIEEFQECDYLQDYRCSSFLEISKAVFETSVLRDDDEGSVFGYPKRDSTTLLLTSVLGYTIGATFSDTREARDCELKAVDIVVALNELWDDGFRVEIRAESSFAQESARAIISDLPLIAMVFVVMSIFTCVVFANFKSKLYS